MASSVYDLRGAELSANEVKLCWCWQERAISATYTIYSRDVSALFSVYVYSVLSITESIA